MGTIRHFALTLLLNLCSIGAVACGGGVAGEETVSLDEDEGFGETDLQIVPSSAPGIVENTPEIDLMMEAEACTVIVETYGAHGLEIGCPTTIKTCPGLFRDSFGVSCMQYDSESITTCLDDIEAATTCGEIRDTVCEVLPIWGSEPQGCAQPTSLD